MEKGVGKGEEGGEEREAPGEWGEGREERGKEGGREGGGGGRRGRELKQRRGNIKYCVLLVKYQFYLYLI